MSYSIFNGIKLEKKYFTALSITTLSKTNTEGFHPIEIPVFKKSISGSLESTCIDQEKQETRHKADNGNKTPFLLVFDSVTLYVFVLFTCNILRGDHIAFQKNMSV